MAKTNEEKTPAEKSKWKGKKENATTDFKCVYNKIKRLPYALGALCFSSRFVVFLAPS